MILGICGFEGFADFGGTSRMSFFNTPWHSRRRGWIWHLAWAASWLISLSGLPSTSKSSVLSDSSGIPKTRICSWIPMTYLFRLSLHRAGSALLIDWGPLNRMSSKNQDLFVGNKVGLITYRQTFPLSHRFISCYRFYFLSCQTSPFFTRGDIFGRRLGCSGIWYRSGNLCLQMQSTSQSLMDFRTTAFPRLM